MKRSWKDKLDDQGLEIVEVAKQLAQITPPATFDMAEIQEWIKKQKEAYSSHFDLEQSRKIKFDLEFVRLFLRMENNADLDPAKMQIYLERAEFPSLRADELEWHQRIFIFLESNPEIRFRVYGFVALAIAMFRHLFGPLLKMQFANKTFNLRVFLARNFEWIAGSLRGQAKKPPGRKSLGLASLIDAILEHQKEPLTQMELYEALQAAGAKVPDDPEAFRLWLHRARKEGLVKNYRSTHAQKENE